MTAISFKLSENEIVLLRQKAHSAKMTVSGFLRDLLSKEVQQHQPRITLKRSRFTGAPAFSSKKGQLPPMTVESVKEMLVDFL